MNRAGFVVCALLVLTWSAPAGETRDWLAKIKAVGKEGAGHAEATKALAMCGGAAKSEGSAPEEVNGHKFLGQVVEGFDPKGLRAAVDDMKKRLGSGIGAPAQLSAVGGATIVRIEPR